MPISPLRLLLAAMLSFSGMAANAAQNPLDRSDPATVASDIADERPDAEKRPATAPKLQPEEARADGMTTGVVGAVRIEGLQALRVADFADVMNDYAGRALAQADMRNLASDVANTARRAGYGLATAWVPPQRIVNGILVVRLEEGRIDAVEVLGAGRASVERSLAPLADGTPVRTADLERRLEVAGDVAGVNVGKVKLERRGTRNILIVATTRQAVSAYASIDNWGSATVGPVRGQFGLTFAGALTDDDAVYIAAVRTILEPEEFGLIRAAYEKPVGTAGTVVSLSGYYAHSQSGSVLKRFDIDGEGFSVAGSVSHPIVRTRKASLWGELGFSLSDSEQTRRALLIRDDRIAALSLTARGFAKLGEDHLRGRVTVTQGIAAFGSTRPRDPLASRFDADGTYTKLDYWLEYQHPLSDVVSVQLQSEGQIATGPLLSSEEMGLGGRNFLRGYDYREFSGDRGISGSAELRFDLGKMPKPVRRGQVYAFADAGTVGNADGGFGGGSLASAGAGLRLWVGRNVAAGIELGVPISDGAPGSSNRDARLSFTIASRF